MVRRVLGAGALAAAMVVASAVPAEAGIPIPCTGESIVKVRDIPNAPRAKNGHRVALGYKFKGCFDGEWVGYIGSRRQYIRLSKRRQLQLIMLAGYKRLPPPPPSRWQHPRELLVPGVWALLLTVGAASTLVKGGGGAPERQPQPRQPKDDAGRRPPPFVQRRRQFAK
jgi:hypothetical protein